MKSGWSTKAKKVVQRGWTYHLAASGTPTENSTEPFTHTTTAQVLLRAVLYSDGSVYSLLF